MSLMGSLKGEMVSDDVRKALVTALSHSDSLLRYTALRAMDILGDCVFSAEPTVMAALLVATHDPEDNNSTLASK